MLLFYFSNRKEGHFYLMTDSTHLIMVIWYIVMDHSVREETCCCHYMGYFFCLATSILLYAPSYRQDSTYHSLCYTSCGTLVGTRNTSMGPPLGIDPVTHHRCSTMELHFTTISLTDALTLVKRNAWSTLSFLIENFFLCQEVNWRRKKKIFPKLIQRVCFQ